MSSPVGYLKEHGIPAALDSALSDALATMPKGNGVAAVAENLLRGLVDVANGQDKGVLLSAAAALSRIAKGRQRVQIVEEKKEEPRVRFCLPEREDEIEKAVEKFVKEAAESSGEALEVNKSQVRLFKKLDANGTGALEKKEIAKILDTLEKVLPPVPGLKEMVEMYTSDGIVEFMEYNSMMRKVTEAIVAVERKDEAMGQDTDPVTVAVEIFLSDVKPNADASVMQNKMQDLFEKIDTNQTSTIEKGEWEVVVKCLNRKMFITPPVDDLTFPMSYAVFAKFIRKVVGTLVSSEETPKEDEKTLDMSDPKIQKMQGATDSFLNSFKHGCHPNLLIKLAKKLFSAIDDGSGTLNRDEMKTIGEMLSAGNFRDITPYFTDALKDSEVDYDEFQECMFEAMRDEMMKN